MTESKDDNKPLDEPKLPPNWRQLAADAISIRVPDAATCKRCTSGGMVISSEPVTPMVYENDGALSARLAHPQALLQCGNCGYTESYNLVILGVVRGDDDE